MPPRNEGLPEGTDHIIRGASETGTRPGGTGSTGSTGGGSGGGSSGSGFVATGGGNDIGTASGGGSGGTGGGGRGTGGGGGSSSGGGASGASGGSGGGGSDGGSSSGGLSADKIVSQVRDQVSSLRDQATDRARELAEGGKDRTSNLLDDVAKVLEDAARSIDEKLGDQYGEYAHRAGEAVSSLAGNLRARTIEDLVEDTRSLVRKSPAVTVGTAALIGFVLVRLVKSGLGGDSNDNGSSGTGA